MIPLWTFWSMLGVLFFIFHISLSFFLLCCSRDEFAEYMNSIEIHFDRRRWMQVFRGIDINFDQAVSKKECLHNASTFPHYKISVSNSFFAVFIHVSLYVSFVLFCYFVILFCFALFCYFVLDFNRRALFVHVPFAWSGSGEFLLFKHYPLF